LANRDYLVDLLLPPPPPPPLLLLLLLLKLLLLLLLILLLVLPATPTGISTATSIEIATLTCSIKIPNNIVTFFELVKRVGDCAAKGEHFQCIYIYIYICYSYYEQMFILIIIIFFFGTTLGVKITSQYY